MSKLLHVGAILHCDGSTVWHVTFDGQYYGSSLVIIEYPYRVPFKPEPTPLLVLPCGVIAKCNKLIGEENWHYRTEGDPDDRSPWAWRVHLYFTKEEDVTMFILGCANHSS